MERKKKNNLRGVQNIQYFVDSSDGKVKKIPISNDFLNYIKQTLDIVETGTTLTCVITVKETDEDDQSFFVLYPADSGVVPKLPLPIEESDNEGHGVWVNIDGKMTWVPLPHR